MDGRGERKRETHTHSSKSGHANKKACKVLATDTAWQSFRAWQDTRLVLNCLDVTSDKFGIHRWHIVIKNFLRKSFRLTIVKTILGITDGYQMWISWKKSLSANIYNSNKLQENCPIIHLTFIGWRTFKNLFKKSWTMLLWQQWHWLCWSSTEVQKLCVP